MTIAILNQIARRTSAFIHKNRQQEQAQANNLANARLNREYQISEVVQDDQGMADFLFTLGCFSGETISISSILSKKLVFTEPGYIHVTFMPNSLNSIKRECDMPVTACFVAA